jgi:CheY-like chemotaxis protein
LNGYEVFSAGDGATGLAIAKQQNPDLILCDIKIPVLDGYHLLQQIHKQPQFNKVLLFLLPLPAKKKILKKVCKWGPMIILSNHFRLPGCSIL